jgi:hypothetical protein
MAQEYGKINGVFSFTWIIARSSLFKGLSEAPGPFLND